MIGKQGVSLLIGHNGVQDKTALDAANEIVARGVYDPTTLSAVDADLQAANIKQAVNIFGKVGTLEQTIVDTELYEEDASTMAGVAQTWTDVTGGSGEVPSGALEVQAALASTAENSAGTQRILYNGVEKVNGVLNYDIPTLISWKGAGIGSAAIIKGQVRSNIGSQDIYCGAVCWYQTLS